MLNILAFSEIIRSTQEPQWPGLTQDIENSDKFRTLPYSQNLYIEDLDVYRTLAYLEPQPNKLNYLRLTKGKFSLAFCYSKKSLKRFYFERILCSSEHLALQYVKLSYQNARNPCSAYENPQLIQKQRQIHNASMSKTSSIFINL